LRVRFAQSSAVVSRLAAADACPRARIPTLFFLGLGSSGENQHASGKAASRECHFHRLSLDRQ
jgi:hypothetical protein